MSVRRPASHRGARARSAGPVRRHTPACCRWLSRSTVRCPASSRSPPPGSTPGRAADRRAAGWPRRGGSRPSRRRRGPTAAVGSEPRRVLRATRHELVARPTSRSPWVVVVACSSAGGLVACASCVCAGGGVEPPHPAIECHDQRARERASDGPPRDPPVVPCADAVEIPQVVAPVSATCSVGGEQANNLIHVE